MYRARNALDARAVAGFAVDAGADRTGTVAHGVGGDPTRSSSRTAVARDAGTGEPRERLASRTRRHADATSRAMIVA